MASPKTIESCWLVFDAEKKGSENQCRGLAEALGVSEIVSKPVPKSSFLQFIPRPLWFFFLRFKKGILKDIGEEGVPDLIISSGTRGSVVGAFLKKKVQNTFLVNILNPRLYHGLFDLIVAPEHDRLTSPNVLEVSGGLHRVTPERLSREAASFKPRHKQFNSPIITVLLGGPGKGFLLEKDHFVTLGRQLSHLHRTRQASFLVSFSRRTPEDFKEEFSKATKGLPLEIYDPLHSKTPNPYFAYLGSADYIIVTPDSISMVAEACSTGKPVYISPLPSSVQKMPKKFRYFHQDLEKKGATKPFLGSLQNWEVVPLQGETARIAQEIQGRLRDSCKRL